jgi:hypothetical protein
MYNRGTSRLEALAMAQTKFDVVIEAVRYNPGGQIDKVRVFARRWLVFSDNFLLDRAALVEQISKGLVFVTGQRKTFVGNVFEIGKRVHLIGTGSPIITTKDQAGGLDFLANVPIF